MATDDETRPGRKGLARDELQEELPGDLVEQLADGSTIRGRRIDPVVVEIGETRKASAGLPRVLRIWKADRLTDQSTPVSGLTIEIKDEIPWRRLDGGITAMRMDDDAQALADALYNALPSGTLNRLTVALMRIKMNNLVVSAATIGSTNVIETLRPHVVVLCGSTRFKDAFDQANYDETMKGNVVLSVGFAREFAERNEIQRYKDRGEDIGCTPAQKLALDDLHKRKIDMADEVIVLNVDGYIGKSTASEIEYAELRGKPIRWLNEPR